MTIARVILQTLIFLSSADVTVNAPLAAGSMQATAPL